MRFCDRYIDRRSRTHDQIVQAARSGVQNIVEGSNVSGTSKKLELKLTGVARASLDELRLDYEDFRRQRFLQRWAAGDLRRAALIARRCATADEVADWVCEQHAPAAPSIRSTLSKPLPTYPELAANAALTLIAVAASLLDRQLDAQARAFERKGGFTEQLHRVRTARRYSLPHRLDAKSDSSVVGATLRSDLSTIYLRPARRCGTGSQINLLLQVQSRRAFAAVLLGFAATLTASSCAKPTTEGAATDSHLISVADAARDLGLQTTLSDQGNRITLERNGRRATLNANARDMVIDGVRVLLGDAVERRQGALYLSRIDFERRLRPLWRPDLAGLPPRVPHVVVLDAGHGGWDPGSENKPLRVQEKDLTLDVVLRLKPLLEAQGWTVILTRDRDTALANAKNADLDARSAIAASSGADVFVSVHFDANASGTLQGSEIFTFAPAHQYATDDWEKAHALGGHAAGTVFDQDVPANRRDEWNTLLAHAMYTHLQPALHTSDLGERIAHWRVLANLPCPGVLVEPAYVSNPLEALRAYAPAFRQQIAEAIATGLGAYADQIKALNAVGSGTSANAIK